jgi:rhodanese-related sulfurtransferase
MSCSEGFFVLYHQIEFWLKNTYFSIIYFKMDKKLNFFMDKTLVLRFIVILAVSGIVYWVYRNYYQARPQDIEQNKVFENVSEVRFDEIIHNDDVVVLDVRTPQEFAEKHIKNADNIDYYDSDLETKLGSLDKQKTYAVYCRSGNRSSQILEVMKKLGFSKVYNLSGGINAYEKSGKNICVGKC